MVDLSIVNAKVVGYEGLQQVAIASGKIIAISSKLNVIDAKSTIDLNGDWLSLGGIDLQINGGLGLAFPDLELTDLPKLKKIGDFLYARGVDGFLPTIVTTSVDKIQRSLFVLAQFISTQEKTERTAQVLGVHLEGPFLNYQKRGAHPPQHLLPLTIENIKRVLGNYSEIVKVITLAPELDGSGQAVSYLKEQNITVSLGHSLATAKEAKEAFKQGASMVTHAFNAMPSLHHRQPGLLGEAIVNPDVRCGLIADGNHVCPTMLEIILKASNYDKGIFIVSDALSPIGLPDGVYPWDDREITVIEGTARLADGTLSGTTLPLLVGVENLVKWGCDLEKAIAMATESPRKAIALTAIDIGQPASFLRWHWNEKKHNLSWTRIN
ncbi:N-acetylglucosamine-6-phosphate deacetylase [Waterburya agarophytonicola K14]|uniref:N-acetylglucosamine-6-phosphate deacetylase n=1 Tax=Waterburya agarophytonicola KI4 TaxID=2874699 RepID=A0A964BPP3_9CYAN|nr:N-acetylglucosamine-6-phosphate deacetylase [Waterburya agarophytonicola]MCC0176994.1 N-acetylglucosamine-6-phosphate deacetylase [Waterburya agarophytonicola KI4]